LVSGPCIPEVTLLEPVFIRNVRASKAPDALAAGTPPGLRDDLVALLGTDCVLTQPIDLIRFAADASLVPGSRQSCRRY
jgi:hypothetical protein